MARKRKADKQNEAKHTKKDEVERSPLHDLWPQIIRYVFESYETVENADEEREDSDDEQDDDKEENSDDEK